MQKVAAVFNQNQLFDPANQNRTFTILRYENTSRDLEVLARGCFGVPETASADIHNQVKALCVAFARIQEDDVLKTIQETVLCSFLLESFLLELLAKEWGEFWSLFDHL
jgi:hypothetical protein